MELAKNIQNYFDKEDDEFIMGNFNIVRREYSDTHYVYYQQKQYVGEFNLINLVAEKDDICKESDLFSIFTDYFKKRKITKNHHVLCIWNTHKSKFSIGHQEDKILSGFVLLWEDEKNGHIIPLSVSINLKNLAPTRQILLEFSHIGNSMWYKYGPRNYNQFSKNKYNGRVQN